MHCPRCGALTADNVLDTLYCSQCGARLTESPAPTAIAANGDASVLPTKHIGGQPEGEPTVHYSEIKEATPFEAPPSQPNISVLSATPALSTSVAPIMEASWAEFSGTTASSTPVPNPNAYPPQRPVDSLASACKNASALWASPSRWRDPSHGQSGSR